jgi:hypothetical protein
MDGHALVDIAGQARLGEKMFLRPGCQFEYKIDLQSGVRFSDYQRNIRRSRVGSGQWTVGSGHAL